MTDKTSVQITATPGLDPNNIIVTNDNPTVGLTANYFFEFTLKNPLPALGQIIIELANTLT
jgi:hypothetical protein